MSTLPQRAVSLSEICLLTNAKRVASVRAETYCNLFSLSVEHFNTVLNVYPLMRRTMESIAAERLNKIGKNPSLVSNREDLQHDLKAVNAILSTQPPPDSDSPDSDSSGDSVRRLPHFRGGKKLKKHSVAMGVSLGMPKTLFGALPRPKSESCFNNMEQQTPRHAAAEAALVAGAVGGMHRSETFYQSTSLAPPLPPEGGGGGTSGLRP